MPRSAPGRRYSFRAHLALFALLATLPITVLAGVLFIHATNVVRQQAETRSLRLAAAISEDIDRFTWPYSVDGTNPPATIQDIEAAERALGVKLPADLCDFYLFSNGFNGVLDERGAYVRLHSLSELISATTGYAVATQFELVLIGDNGGDYGFALDLASSALRYVELPLAASSGKDIIVLGDTFAAFLTALLHRSDPRA
jgi:hypothetical protein